MNAEFFDFGKTVKFTWEDSASNCGWRGGPTVPDVGTIVSVGQVVGCDQNAIVITTSINDQQSCMCPLSVPWSAILEIRELPE